jgi:hypothetical protein
MDAGIAAVLVGVITTMGAIAVAVIQIKGMRNENREDHAIVQSQLQRIFSSVLRVDGKIDHVGKRLDDHLLSHKEGKFTDGDAG